MGTYVYSLRKAHKEVLVDGLYPVDVMPLRYAYKISNPWPGDYGYAAYQRMVGRVDSQATRAQDHHLARTHAEFGDEDRWYYVCVGGDKDFEEGLDVYRTKNLPALWCDGGGIPGAEYVGKLYKINRTTWTVESKCPGHTWKGGASKGDFRPGYTRWWDAETCTRCGDSRYADPSMEALKAEYDRQCELRASHTYEELKAMQAAA